MALTDVDVNRLGSNDEPWFCSKCICDIITQNPESLDLITCPACQKPYKKKGLKRHWRSAHKELDYYSYHPPSLGSQDAADTQPLPEKLSFYKKNIRILKRIPKGARSTAAFRLAQTIEECTTKNDFKSWETLITFSYAAFKIPEKSNKSLSHVVKKNIASLSIDDMIPRIAKPSSAASLAKRIESKISEGDIRGAVKLLASDDSLAPEDELTLKCLQLKHPSPSRSLSLPDEPTPQEIPCISNELVRWAISSFPNGSSAGIDGMRPQHLKDLTATSNGDAGSRLVRAIATLCNLMLSGNVPMDVCRILYGANLCALRKKDGGLRPIAAGLTLRRLVGKIACKVVGESVGEYLRPVQIGVNTRGGCEAAVHATRAYVQKHKNTNHVLLKIDAKNAFNSIERDSMLTAIKDQIPFLYNYLWQAYSSPTLLFFGEKTLLSQVGAQQGDPCGPMIFSLTIHPVIESLSSDLNIWYLDDGTLAGPPETVLRDFEILMQRLKHVGLEINPAKCEIYFMGDFSTDVYDKFSTLSPGIRIVKDELELLSSPIISSNIEKCFEDKFSSLRRLFSRLKEVPLHISYYLLRHCLMIPKMTYLLRTTAAWYCTDLLHALDEEFRATLEDICNSKFSESQWTLASLPIRFGGLGIRKLDDIALPAYLSSSVAVLELVNLMLKEISDEPSTTDYSDGIMKWTGLGLPFPIQPSSQNNWDAIRVINILDNLDLANLKDNARFLAAQRSEANAWLSTLPSRCLGTLLDNNTFRISIALRYGLHICMPHRCSCGVNVEEDGTHGLSCPKRLGRHSRHHEINNILCRALHSAKIPAILEPTGLSRDDGKRVDGMTLIPWEKGQILLWDATCSNTLASSYLDCSSVNGGAVATKAASRKCEKYRSLIDRNYCFVPFAVETLGPWCIEAIQLVNRVGSIIHSISGEPKSKLYIRQRISIAIQRGNAACVMETFPAGCSMEEIFYIL